MISYDKNADQEGRSTGSPYSSKKENKEESPMKKILALAIVVAVCLSTFAVPASEARADILHSIRVSGFSELRSRSPLVDSSGNPPAGDHGSSNLVNSLRNPSNFGPDGIVGAEVEFLPFVNQIESGSLVDSDGRRRVDLFFAGLTSVTLTTEEVNELVRFVEGGGVLYMGGNSGSNEGPSYNPLFKALGITDCFAASTVWTGNHVQSSTPIDTPITRGPFGIVGPLTHTPFRAIVTGDGTVGVATGYGSSEFIVAEGSIGSGYIAITGDPLYFNFFTGPDLDNLRYFLNLFALAGVPGQGWVRVTAQQGAYICSHVEDRESYRGVSLGFVFDKDLDMEVSDSAVKHLQIILNANPLTQVATAGGGSPGSETQYFGARTKTAVENFQGLHGLSKTGNVTDSATKTALNKLLRVLEHSPVKLVPNTWALRLMSTHSDSKVSSGIVWWEVEDVTDGVRGWVPKEHLTVGPQNELQQRTKLVLRWTSDAPTIRHDFLFRDDLRSGQTSDDVKYLQMILKVEVGETLCPVDKVTLIYPAAEDATGRYGPITIRAVRAFQVKYGLAENGEVVGEEMRNKLNDSLRNGKYELSQTRTALIRHGVTTHIDAYLNQHVPGDLPAGVVLGMVMKETAGEKYDNTVIGYAAGDWGRGILQIDSNHYVGIASGLRWFKNGLPDAGRDNREMTRHYYTNTAQGIEANIKDALRVLRDKHSAVAPRGCYNRGSSAVLDPASGLYREQIGTNLVIYSSDQTCLGRDGGSYDSSIVRIMLGEEEISIGELGVVFSVWAYNSFRVYRPGIDWVGTRSDYIRVIGDDLGNISSVFGYNMPQREAWMRKLKGVAAAASTFIQIKSPGDLQVLDSDGRLTGLVDDSVQEAIPFSWYDMEEGGILIPLSYSSYRYRVVGTQDGVYGIEITFSNSGYVHSFVGSGLPVSVGEVHEYTIDWDALARGEKGVTVYVDSDGDGEFDRTFTTGSELAGDEFILKTETIVKIDPETLNLKARGRWLTGYVELPADYAAEDIDISTVHLLYNGEELYADWGDIQDGVFMAKFDWATVAGWFDGLHDVGVELTVAGEVDGVEFEGTAIIRVIDPPLPPRRGR